MMSYGKIYFVAVLCCFLGVSADDLDTIPFNSDERILETGCGRDQQEIEYYNVQIDVDCDGDCNDDDIYHMGGLIQDVIDEVDKDVPNYRGEKMETTLCSDARRLLLTGHNRLLGRYSYRGGGRCRRCKLDNIDRRFLKETPSVDLICEEANKAMLYQEDAEKAVEQVNKLCAQLEELVKDDEKAIDYMEKCEEEANESVEDMEKTSKSAELSKGYCKKAEKLTSEKELKKHMENAKKATKEAAKSRLDAWKHYYKANEVKTKVDKERFDVSLDLQKEEMEQQMEAMDAMIDEIEREEERLEDLLENTRDSTQKQEYQLKLKKLELQKESLKTSKEQEEKFLKEQLKYEEKVAKATIDALQAHSEEEWYGKFSKLLELQIPHYLLDEYSVDRRGRRRGCIDPNSEVIVEVQVFPGKDKSKTLSQGQSCEEFS